MGQMELALAEVRKAQELDPLSLIINTHLGFLLYASGDYEGAIDQLKKMLELNSKFPPAHEILGVVKAEQHKISEAEEEIMKAIDFSGGSPGLMASLAYAYAICGKRDQATKILGEIKSLSDQYISPDSIAQVLSGLGERDEAFHWLEKAHSARSSKIVDLKIEPAFYNLHADTRFTELLSRMNLS
jgi:tetratricopeptide (TPR) repeat protein